MRTILLVFAAFAGMISYMVYRCVQTPVDLVTKEYYKDELAYQQVIDGKKQVAALSGKITLQQSAETIVLQLPAEMKNGDVKGTLLFYCASDAEKDKSFLLTPDADGKQTLDGTKVKPGRYTVKIAWLSKGVHYFAEQPFERTATMSAASVPGA